MAKDNRYWREIKRNTPNWKSWTVDIRRNVRLAHSSVRTIRDNADRIKESAKSGSKVYRCVARLPQSFRNERYQNLSRWVSYIWLNWKRI